MHTTFRAGKFTGGTGDAGNRTSVVGVCTCRARCFEKCCTSARVTTFANLFNTIQCVRSRWDGVAFGTAIDGRESFWTKEAFAGVGGRAIVVFAWAILPIQTYITRTIDANTCFTRIAFGAFNTARIRFATVATRIAFSDTSNDVGRCISRTRFARCCRHFILVFTWQARKTIFVFSRIGVIILTPPSWTCMTRGRCFVSLVVPGRAWLASVFFWLTRLCKFAELSWTARSACSRVGTV